MTERIAYGPDGIERAAAVIAAGGTVAFPTETVYGLGARADRGEAVRAIFEAKGRPLGNPLIVHVADAEAARALAAEWPGVAARLADAFWPGPLTLVVRRRPGAIADEVTAGGDTVALRVPGHAAARELVLRAGVPIAAPSANRSTSISPTTADHVVKTLGGRIDLVLDGGPTPRGIESTIIDVTHDPPHLLRYGAIPVEALAPFGPIVDATAAATSSPGSARARAPGSYLRHYAPRATLLVVPAAALDAEARVLASRGERVGVVDRGDSAAGGPLIRSLPVDAGGYESRLYAALHELDDAGCDVILVADVPADPRWAAIRDRLRRAAHPGSAGGERE